MNIRNDFMSIEKYITCIKNDVKFRQANYGDGEWFCIFGKEGQNEQGDIYTKKLRKELIETLTNPQFTFFGTIPQHFTHRPQVEALLRKIEDWVETNLSGHNLLWVSKDILSNANVKGELGPFIKTLKEKKVMLIGPPHLADLKIFKPCIRITVPLPGAQNVIDETVTHIIELERNVDIICFSSGIATNVMMHKIMIEMGDDAPTMLDTGSLWDPYVGVWSRSTYKKEIFQTERMQKNLKGAE